MVEESFTLLVADKLKKGCRALMKYGKQIVWSSRYRVFRMKIFKSKLQQSWNGALGLTNIEL